MVECVKAFPALTISRSAAPIRILLRRVDFYFVSAPRNETLDIHTPVIICLPLEDPPYAINGKVGIQNRKINENINDTMYRVQLMDVLCTE